MKLLSVSKSFAGGRNQPGRYKMAEQGLLPKFAPMGRPVSLAPKRKSDEPPSIQGANGTPNAPPNSLQFFQVPEPVVKPVNAAAPTPRAARFAADVSANWFRLGSQPLLNRPAGKSKHTTTTQAELSLDAVKPVRNDLSDSDLQIVPAKTGIEPDASKRRTPRLLRPELTGLAWSRLTARFLNSERVRA